MRHIGTRPDHSDQRGRKGREDLSNSVGAGLTTTRLTRTSRNMISPTTAVRTPPLFDFIIYVDSTYPPCIRRGFLDSLKREREREKKKTHLWKSVKALYRRNLIQLFEEGHAFVITVAVLVCKVYEVRLIHRAVVRRGCLEVRGEVRKRRVNTLRVVAAGSVIT